MSESSKFGRYELLGELGQGGMATVYHATDPSFGREVAIKVLPLTMQQHAQFRERFQREGRMIAALEHPNIVPVYDVGEENGVPFLVMRYMSGGTLNEHINEGGMSLEQAAHIVSRLASALDQAHKRGIVHRDLKPSNILFDHYGEAYISDFGIAKLAEESMNLTGSGVIGTPTYMSPEQASGEQGIDGRSDVYALGVVLFHMLTGRLPFEAETPMGVAVKHITEPIPDILAARPSLPEAMRIIMQKALAKTPDLRYQTAGALAEDLEALASGQPPKALSAPMDDLHTAPMAAATSAPHIPVATTTRKAETPTPATVIESRAATEPAKSGMNPVLIGLGALALIVIVGLLVIRPWENQLAGDATLPPSEEATEATEAPTEARTENPPTDVPTPIPTAEPTEGPTALFAENDLAEAEGLVIDMELGASTLVIEAADEQVTTMSASFEADPAVAIPDANIVQQGRITRLTVAQEIPGIFVIGEDPMGSLSMQLPRHVPLELMLSAGMGETVVDLTDLDVRKLSLTAGAGTMRVLLPKQGDLEIAVQGTVGELSFEAPDDPSTLTIRSFEIVETIGTVRVELPAAGTYTVTVSPYTVIDFLIPENVDVKVNSPNATVTIEVLNPRITSDEPGVWQTEATADNPNRVLIDVTGQLGTIRLLSR